GIGPPALPLPIAQERWGEGIASTLIERPAQGYPSLLPQLLAQELELEPLLLGGRKLGLGGGQARGRGVEGCRVPGVEAGVRDLARQSGNLGLEPRDGAGQRLERVLLLEGQLAASGRRGVGPPVWGS